MRISLIKVIFFLMIVALTLLSCELPISFSENDSELPAETESWQVAVDDIRGMTRGMGIPQHLIDPEKPAIDSVFDPNQLLIPLTHLQLRPGYTLDFVYRYDGMGGRPFLYARKQSDTPFESYGAFQAEQDACRLADVPKDCDYLDFVESDGTEEGYFQWVLLQTMGDQFYLYWHSGIDDVEILASKDRLNTLVADLSETDFGEPLSAAQRRQALRIDPAPRVEISDVEVRVWVTWFTRWGGFYETFYTITRTAPHGILTEDTQQLIEYECQVVF